MGRFRAFLHKRILVLFLVLMAASLLLMPIHQVVQASMPISQSQTLIAQADFIVDWWERIKSRWKQPPATAPSGRSRGGAGRGSICSIAESDSSQDSALQSVVALVYTQAVSPDKTSVGGYTVEAQPTFWFYLPYVSSVAEKQVARFTLLDESKQVVWHELVAIELSQTPQIVEYSLPFSLATGELYNWYFSAICDPEKPSKNSSVQGWVQRIEPDIELRNALQNANLLQKQEYRVYANNGIWFETINSLVKSRRQFPTVDQFREDWMGLLAYFDIPPVDELDALTPAKIVEREVVTDQSQLPARM